MAAEVLVGSERRVLISALPAPPPPDSLLARLDQIDLRLRQLEEERRPSSVAEDDGAGRGAHPPPRHQHSKSMPSALQPQDARDVRGTLMERLNLLESRIRQLSCELDLDGSVGGKVAASSLPTPVPRPAEDCAWSEPPLPEPTMRARAAAAAGGGGAGASWSAVQILQRGALQLNRNKPSHPAKVKKLKEAKCACEEEKRKAERAGRASAGRRWFTVGC